MKQSSFELPLSHFNQILSPASSVDLGEWGTGEWMHPVDHTSNALTKNDSTNAESSLSPEEIRLIQPTEADNKTSTEYPHANSPERTVCQSAVADDSLLRVNNAAPMVIPYAPFSKWCPRTMPVASMTASPTVSAVNKNRPVRAFSALTERIEEDSVDSTTDHRRVTHRPRPASSTTDAAATHEVGSTSRRSTLSKIVSPFALNNVRANSRMPDTQESSRVTSNKITAREQANRKTRRIVKIGMLAVGVVAAGYILIPLLQHGTPRHEAKQRQEPAAAPASKNNLAKNIPASPKTLKSQLADPSQAKQSSSFNKTHQITADNSSSQKLVSKKASPALVPQTPNTVDGLATATTISSGEGYEQLIQQTMIQTGNHLSDAQAFQAYLYVSSLNHGNFFTDNSSYGLPQGGYAISRSGSAHFNNETLGWLHDWATTYSSSASIAKA